MAPGDPESEKKGSPGCAWIWILIRHIKQKQNDARRRKQLEKRPPGWAKVSPSVAKTSSKRTEGSRKLPKWIQKGAKEEPQGYDFASKHRPSDKVATRSWRGSPPEIEIGFSLGVSFHRQSITPNHKRSNHKQYVINWRRPAACHRRPSVLGPGKNDRKSTNNL